MKIQFIFLIFLFTSSVLQAQNWLPLAGGTDWPISSFFADTITNQLYIGGRFKSADGKNIRGIGVWDGAEWHGRGVNLGSKALELEMVCTGIWFYNLTNQPSRTCPGRYAVTISC